MILIMLTRQKVKVYRVWTDCIGVWGGTPSQSCAKPKARHNQTLFTQNRTYFSHQKALATLDKRNTQYQ